MISMEVSGEGGGRESKDSRSSRRGGREGEGVWRSRKDKEEVTSERSDDVGDVRERHVSAKLASRADSVLVRTEEGERPASEPESESESESEESESESDSEDEDDDAFSIDARVSTADFKVEDSSDVNDSGTSMGSEADITPPKESGGTGMGTPPFFEEETMDRVPPGREKGKSALFWFDG